MAHETELRLPVSVTGPIDLGRLTREIETINEAMLQLALRKTGKEVKMPKTSPLLDKVAETNKLNLLQEPDRKRLLEFLRALRKSAPVLHISFSTNPSAAFLEKLVAWLRKEIDPLVLVTIGLQPTLGAGCVVRTPSRQMDFSLRQDFLKKRDLLISQLTAAETAP